MPEPHRHLTMRATVVREGSKGAETGWRGAKFIMVPSCAGEADWRPGQPEHYDSDGPGEMSESAGCSNQRCHLPVAPTVGTGSAEAWLQCGRAAAVTKCMPGLLCFEHQPVYLLSQKAQHCFPRTKFRQGPPK